MKAIRIWWICECGNEIAVDVSPYIPAKLYGPPENCYPAEGPELDTTECPKCGATINEEEAFEKANQKAKDDADDYADHKYQEWKDRKCEQQLPNLDY